jgi:hypothetical protein
VPLGVTSQATFHVVNAGYDNLELRYRLPADGAHTPLSLTFPQVGTLPHNMLWHIITTHMRNPAGEDSGTELSFFLACL